MSGDNRGWNDDAEMPDLNALASDRSTEFGQMMQHAMGMKNRQVKDDRSLFERKPDFVKNTLFHCMPRKTGPNGELGDITEEQKMIMRARESTSFEERIDIALSLKRAGNELFKAGDFYGANDKYEKAFGCFTHYVSSEPDWRSKGIKDEDLTLVEYKTADEVSLARATELQATCVSNISACFFKLKDYAKCTKVATEALNMDPTNVKALYRRALATTIPKKSGAAELDMAIKDLSDARKLDPNDTQVAKMLRKLKGERKSQRAKDRSTFSSMFSRGSIITEDEISAAKAKEHMLAYARARKQAEEMERMAKACEFRGRTDDAAELRAASQKARAAMRSIGSPAPPTKVDFSNPSEEMIRDAKKHGLDLTDPMVQRALSAMQEGTGSDFALDESMQVQHKQNVAKEKRSRVSFYITLFVVLAFLYRVWSMGILDKLVHGFRESSEEL